MFRLRVHHPTDARPAARRCRIAGRPETTLTGRIAAKGTSMSLGLIGYKIGMTQMFTENGAVEPVTVLQLGPCPVLQIRYPSVKTDHGETRKDGYSAVQLGFKDKPRKSAT